MSKKGDGIRISIGGAGYSIGSTGGYSIGSSGYSLTGFGKGYGLAGRLDSSSRTGYSSMAAGGYANAGMKMKGYSFMKPSLYGPVNLFPVPYGRIPDPLDEARRLYKKKCPKCGNESMSHGYSLN